MPVVPVPQKAEAGESLELRSWEASLDNTATPQLKTKQNKTKTRGMLGKQGLPVEAVWGQTQGRGGRGSAG
jgi:hypothetical protein